MDRKFVATICISSAIASLVTQFTRESGGQLLARPTTQATFVDQRQDTSGRLASVATAARLIPFQAYLTDAASKPVTDSVDLTFRLFDLPTGGQSLGWTELHVNIPVNMGMVNVILGRDTPEGTPFGDISFDGELYIEVQVGTNPPMVPRQQIIPAIFAADADRAELASEAVLSHHAENLVIPGTTELVVIVDGNGRVGIGSSVPTAKLDVNGGISANGDVSITGSYVGLGIVPVGTIMAWHKTPNPNDRNRVLPLPNGWMECKGGLLPDDSPLRSTGATNVPDLRHGRFLRGHDHISGIMQDDAFQGHHHQTKLGISTFVAGQDPASEILNRISNTQGHFEIDVNPIVRVLNPTSAGNGPVRTDEETRPINMSVVWIMRVK